MALRIKPLQFLRTVQPEPPAPVHRMATVVQTSPLAIQFDGETPYFYDASLAITATLATGQRVIVARIANGWVITNVMGLVVPDPPFAYPTSMTAWTTTWLTSTGANTPVKNDGVFTFRYVTFGTLCVVNFSIVMGSLTNFNGGGAADNWQWTLPFTASNSTGKMGFATAINSANSAWPLAPQITAGTNKLTFMLVGCGATSAGLTVNAANGGVVDALTPFTWTASSANFINGQIAYEI